ncbi:MAG: class I SAM-dependent methyltransferase [Pseudomonadota bacterium]
MKRCLACHTAFDAESWTCPACGFTPTRLNGFLAHAPALAEGGGGFKPHYFAKLAELEAKNFWFRSRNELILWALGRYAPDSQNLLEIGCGTGYVLSGIAAAYPQLALCGSEIFMSGIPFAAERLPAAELMQMDARQLPFVDAFDVVGAFDVLEHIEEDEAVLAQVWQALKPGGCVMLSVPQHPRLWSVTDDYACHVRRYRRGELEAKAEQAGFTVERSTSFVTVLLPLMAASRARLRHTDGDFNPATELEVNPVIDSALYALLALERRLIGLGVSLPVGGSRLVVARKPG